MAGPALKAPESPRLSDAAGLAAWPPFGDSDSGVDTNPAGRLMHVGNAVPVRTSAAAAASSLSRWKKSM